MNWIGKTAGLCGYDIVLSFLSLRVLSHCSEEISWMPKEDEMIYTLHV